MTQKHTESTKKVLFSGRFDPVHCGHWVTVLRLAKRFKKVLIVILDNGKRKKPAFYIMQIFNEMINLSNFSNKIEVIINKTHFAEISKEEIDSYECDVYAAAENMEVLEHVCALMPCVYLDRAYGFAASKYIDVDKL